MVKTLDIPSILVIAGIACIVLAILGRISGKYVIIIPVERQFILVGLGVLLLVLGLIPYISTQLNKIRKGITETGVADLREAEKIAADFIKGKVKGSKITISKTKEENGFYKIEGTAISSSGVVKYFTVEMEAKTKKIRSFDLHDSPWDLTSSR